MKRATITRFVLCLLIVALASLFSSSELLAHPWTGLVWQVPAVPWWSDITPENNYGIFPPDTRDQMRLAAGTWNGVADLGFHEYYPNKAWFSAADLVAWGYPPYWLALTNPPLEYPPSYIYFVDSYFNTWWNWSTDGNFDCWSGYTGGKFMGDVRTIAIHEMGHWLDLLDLDPWYYIPESVMYRECRQKWSLGQHDRDDLLGIYGGYGFYTGWEDTQPIGYGDLVLYQKDMAGYFCNQSPPPEASRVGVGEFGVGEVPGWGGYYHIRMAGCAQNPYSYVYFKLFDTWITVQPGMYLWWHQYNYQQSIIGVDAHFTDGTTLRDSGLRDIYGVSVHPGNRGVYPTGQWMMFQVDLSPLAGKTMYNIMVAYDNAGNGQTGQFRAYIDNISIGRPHP